MSLNEKQKLFFEEVRRGSNICLSSEAGTGKSFCIKVLIEELIKNNSAFGVTATTGIAALNIGGATIFSYCGIGLGEEDADFLVNRIRKMAPIRIKLLKTKILIIDEVSMLSAELLDKLDYIFKKIRNKDKPFGGIQMIFSGDYLQLPVIERNGEGRFAFESQAWKNGNIVQVVLTEQMRQKNDADFAKVLSEIRVGNTTNIDFLLKNQPNFPDDGIKPVVLYCLNKLVERHNEGEVAKLPGSEKKYYCNTTGDKKNVESLTKSCPALEIVGLKEGAQVILLQNIDVEGGLVNGSLGVVKKLGPTSVTVKFSSGEHEVERYSWELKKQSIGDDGGTKFKTAATFNQIPLKLAYSITCHKSVGLTLERVILDAAGAFCDGLIYVALSRVRSKDSLVIKNLDINRITANQKALQFYGYSAGSSQNVTPKFLGFTKKEKEKTRIDSAEDDNPFLW